MAQEHFMYQNGQMYRIRNQEKVKLNEPATLPVSYTHLTLPTSDLV